MESKLDPTKMPKHIAFIMDGNGRWAKKRGMPRTFGHKHGYVKMKMAVKHCVDLNIRVISIFAFSTENWNRPKDEIDEIFRLIREGMHEDSSLFMKWNVKVVTMGDLTKFPKDMYDKLVEVMEKTKNNTGTIFNLCANYGGRSDIVRAVNTILKERSNSGKEESVTEQEFEKYLYGAGLPPPDLIVRTSGEQRISNFMLWQMAYSEFLFIKPHWPAMTPKLIDKCILDYQSRDRRFGKIAP